MCLKISFKGVSILRTKTFREVVLEFWGIINKRLPPVPLSSGLRNNTIQGTNNNIWERSGQSVYLSILTEESCLLLETHADDADRETRKEELCV